MIPADPRMVEPPPELGQDEVRVWWRLAPYAVAKRTLTPGTADAFAMLCRAIVLERQMGASEVTKGRADHRGMIATVEKGLYSYQLAPAGRPMYEPEDARKPSNPLEKFLNRKRA